MSARRCIAPACRPSARPEAGQEERARSPARGSGPPYPRRARAKRSPPAARPCATLSSPTASTGVFQQRFAVYDREGEKCPCRAAAARSGASCRRAARPSIVRTARNSLSVARNAEMPENAMTYENIIVETHDAVGLIRLNRPQGAQCAERALIAELARRSTPSTRMPRSAPSSSPAARRPSPPAPTSRRCAPRPIWRPISASSSPSWDTIAAAAQAGDRRGGGLCASAAAASWR